MSTKHTQRHLQCVQRGLFPFEFCSYLLLLWLRLGLQGSKLVAGLDLDELSALDKLLQESAEGLGEVLWEVVVGLHVLGDSLGARSGTILQGNQGGLDHLLIWWVGWARDFLCGWHVFVFFFSRKHFEKKKKTWKKKKKEKRNVVGESHLQTKLDTPRPSTRAMPSPCALVFLRSSSYLVFVSVVRPWSTTRSWVLKFQNPRLSLLSLSLSSLSHSVSLPCRILRGKKVIVTAGGLRVVFPSTGVPHLSQEKQGPHPWIWIRLHSRETRNSKSHFVF